MVRLKRFKVQCMDCLYFVEESIDVDKEDEMDEIAIDFIIHKRMMGHHNATLYIDDIRMSTCDLADYKVKFYYK